MDNNQVEAEADMNTELMLDGNAVAGLLQDLFGEDMTASPTECASCGCEGDLATLLAFTQSPGIVLRCPACESVMIRIVRTPNAIYLDARGVVYLRVEARDR